MAAAISVVAISRKVEERIHRRYLDPPQNTNIYEPE